jgi:hypothetical protein
MGSQQAAVLSLSLLVPHPIFQMSFDKSTHYVILLQHLPFFINKATGDGFDLL